MPVRFTERLLAALPAPADKKDQILFDTECRGLGVRITRTSKVFILERRDPAGRKYRQPLGAWGAITLEQARSAARAAVGRAATGIDLRAERAAKRAAARRQQAEQALSLARLVADWSQCHLAYKRPRYAAEAQRALRYSLDALMDKPAARISRADATAALDAIAKAGRVAMAARVMAYARACYRWAMRRGMVDANPFADLPVPAATPQRERTLTDSEMRAVWAAMDRLGYPFGPMFRLLALTLVRQNEAAGARWSELDEDLTVWRVPPSRAKQGRAAHVVPVAAPVRDLLRSIPRIDGQDLIFSTTGCTAVSGFSKAKARLDQLSGVTDWRLHDLRRTGVSKLAQLGVDPVTADRLLDHQPHRLSAVARVYQRHNFYPEQSRALERWAAWLSGALAAEADAA